MPYNPHHVPVYRHKKSRDLAVVTINGRDIYLGKFNSIESRHKYDKLIQEWLASGRVLTSATPLDEEAFSVAELIVAYMKHAKVYYQKDEKPTSPLHNVEDAMTYLKNLYGLEAVKDFGPLKLKAVRQQMIGKKLGRTTINKYIDNIKRMFKWGTENELVPSSVFHGLQAISGLRKGRCEAKEYPPVKPVPEAFIEAIKDPVSKQVWGMIQLQVFTGMRPDEVVLMRGQPWVAVQILIADKVRSGHVEIQNLEIESANALCEKGRPHAYGVGVVQGAFTLWNLQSDESVVISANLSGISVGRIGRPVLGSGIFISGADEKGGRVAVQSLEAGPVYSDAQIPPGTADTISGGVFTGMGVTADNVHITAPVTTYGAKRHGSALAGYYGLIDSLDHEMGRLMKSLDEMGLAENTLLVFNSDHGDMHGSQGLHFKSKPEDQSLETVLRGRR
jgi:hypothetical protein